MSRQQGEQPVPTATSRAPELVPTTVPWGSSAVRERLWVDEQGALRWTDGTNAPVKLAGRGEVVAVRLAQSLSTKGVGGFLARLAGEGAHDGPLLVLDRRGAGPVVVALDGWWPARWSSDIGRRLTDTGGRSLLAALGRDDAWTFDVGAPAGAVLTGRPRVLDPRRTLERQGRRALLTFRVSGLLGFLAVTVGVVLSLLHGGAPSVRAAPWVVALFTLCSLVPVAATWWERRRARRLPALAPGAHRVEVLGPGGRIGWLERAVDNTLTVLRDGQATVLPGAPAGGVTLATALVPRGRTAAAVLLSADATTVAAFGPTGGLTVESRDQLRDLLTESGVAWEDRTVPTGSPELSGLGSTPRPSPWDEQVGLLGAFLALATAGVAVGAHAWFVIPVNIATGVVAVALTLEPLRRRR